MKPALVIDNFAGGGGASTGIEAALGRKVDVAINHDEAAIAVHTANHPGTRHYCQSIFAVDPLDATGGAIVALAWFSPDCKHHSKAKGGKPREKNIRDMAWVVPHWIERLGDWNGRTLRRPERAPQVIMLENVEEFRHWGPLDAKGKPIPERKGEEFDLWERRIRRLGYKVEHRELRACDYGAPTSRKRLFLIARRDGLPIVWPEPTHGAPDSEGVKTGRLLPWRTAAECIDWTIPCPSIFDRKIPLKDNTCKRVAAGVMRYVVNAARPFIVPVTNTGWNPDRLIDADKPLPTVTTAKGGEMASVAPTLVSVAHGDSGGRREYPATDPLGTVTAKGNPHALSAASLIRLRNNNVARHPETPLDTITAGGKHHAVVAAFMAQHNSGVIGKDMREPLSTVVHRGTQQQPVEVTMIERGALPDAMLDRAQMVTAFLVKYYGTDQAPELAEPLHTVTTRDRFAVVTCTIDAVTYVIVDIGMRMLTPRELANAQGFPPDYVLDPECWYRTDRGNLKFGRLPKSHQIAKIGNAVCPPMSRALVQANLGTAAASESAAA